MTDENLEKAILERLKVGRASALELRKDLPQCLTCHVLDEAIWRLKQQGRIKWMPLKCVYRIVKPKRTT